MDKITDSALKSEAASAEFMKDLGKNPIQNKKLRGKLYKKGNVEGTKTYGLEPTEYNQPSSFNFKSDGSKIVNEDIANRYAQHLTGERKETMKRMARHGKKANRDITEGKVDNIVVHKPKDGDEILGHEFGHIENTRSKGFKKLINNLDIKHRPDLIESIQNLPKHISNSKPSLRQAGKRWIRGKAVLMEEKNASRNGLKMMKEAGYSKEDLEIAKKNLKIAEKTYEPGINISPLSSLYKKVQIPSRRGLDKVTRDVRSSLKRKKK